LYFDREAVVDEDLRLTYEEFGRRCDRWSAALQRLGVGKGDRVAYIAPNTHALLESFYAVPQIGAVLVPINYRLIADDFAYIIGHSGAKVICAHSDYLEVVERIRHELPEVKHVVALEGLTDALREAGWLDYESILANAPETFSRPPIAEDDLLTINYTSGTTSRPKGVMITHRNAYMNVVGTLIHISMSPADRYLWTLPMFHANGWTFVWIVTAVGGTHVCLRKVEPRAIFTLIRDEGITLLCAAPTVLIGIANAPEDVRHILLPAEAGSTLSTKASQHRHVRVLTAGAPPAAATIERVEGELGWEVTQVYGLTETAPFLTICEPRPEHATLSPQGRGGEASVRKPCIS
jgi:fatty-acyl-CoA synthase